MCIFLFNEKQVSLKGSESEFKKSTYVSANTIRVREAFSIVNFVLPS
jgi:hypothetical protein